MIRVDLSAEPKRWQTVALIDEEGNAEDARIQYALLDRETVARYRKMELEMAAQSVGFRHQSADETEERRFYASLMDRLDPAESAERHDLLMRHIRGWDFEGVDGQTLPCDDIAKAAILRRADWFGPLWYGLLEASEGAGKKPARNG